MPGTGEEKLRQALELGVKMRKAQTLYFKTRDRSDLATSKRLEKEFDAAAKEALEGGSLL